MFRRLEVRLIIMVAAVLIITIGFTLYLVWWVDTNTITTVTTGGNGTNIREEVMPLGQLIGDSWPLLLVALAIPSLIVIVPLIVRAVSPVHHLAKEAESLAMPVGENLESKFLKDDIQSLSQSFRTIASRLAHTDQLRRNMVNDVAHELRSPLTNIQCQLEAIQDGLVEPDGEMINSLYEEIMLLKRLTDDLQELALAEAGRMTLAIEPVNVKELIYSVVQATKPQSLAEMVELNVEIDNVLPVVEMDNERIQQVLRNLLDNSIRYTPPGGKIVVTAEADDDMVLIRVQDSGEGLPQEALADVFERFYRVDPSRNRKSGGAGLGLAIVKQIVEAHNGRTWAENAPRKGAIFNILLPLTQ